MNLGLLVGGIPWLIPVAATDVSSRRRLSRLESKTLVAVVGSVVSVAASRVLQLPWCSVMVKEQVAEDESI
jgi:hypothetical protein